MKTVKSPIKFYHIKNKRKNHIDVVTVASQVLETGEVAFGFAFLSKKDRFNKRIGREIALGRIANNCYNNCIVVPFSGHSADDLVQVWHNDRVESIKPTSWKNVTLTNDINFGLRTSCFC